LDNKLALDWVNWGQINIVLNSLKTQQCIHADWIFNQFALNAYVFNPCKILKTTLGKFPIKLIWY
jgi:hypothetical protein